MAEKKKNGKKAKKSDLELNHAMVYSTDVPRALAFYQDALGFEVIEQYGNGYSRMVSPGGKGTIGLHALDPGQEMHTPTEGLRLYFEIKKLDRFCAELLEKGVAI